MENLNKNNKNFNPKPTQGYFIGFKNQRKHPYGKVVFTKYRIIQCIREIVKRAGGARCYPTVRRIVAITEGELSEPTIRRYLKDCIQFIIEADGVVLEEEKGKGYRLCTQEWLDLVAKNGDLFKSEKCLRSTWIKSKQRNKILAYTPPIKIRGPYIGKDKSNNNNTFVPKGMMILAINLLKKHPLPHLPRFKGKTNIKRLARTMLSHRLTAGECQKKAITNVFNALKITDTAISDGLTHSPEKYVWGVLRFTPLSKLTKKELNQNRLTFWQSQKELQIQVAKSLDLPPCQNLHSYIESKILSAS